MKSSLKLMKYLVGSNQDLPINELDIVERIGAQLGAIERVDWLKTIYERAVIVRVVSVKPLEGSDHLHLCTINDDNLVKDIDRLEDGTIQVVCGAANVKENIFVVWLPPGTIVPASIKKTPFKLTVRNIMGVVSHGMLASAAELSIGDDHEGIVVIANDVKEGTSLVEYLNLDDLVVDIENKMFTHRPDLFGQLGIARELCGIYNQAFISPDWYQQDRSISSAVSGKLRVVNEISTACPRFMAVVISGLRIGPSPLWLQSYLSRVGIRPISNIVDITNFVMIATGQPLHAYDLSKIINSDGKVELIIRKPHDQEKLKLIDGSTIDLDQSDIVIANQEKSLGLGGVMGGFDSEVSPTTTEILLECANFDMYTIRRSSMTHGIFSEAVTRFNKGQSPWQCPVVLAYAVDLIKQICEGAKIISEVADEKSEDIKRVNEVSVSLELVNTYLGITLDEQTIIKLLNNVELKARVNSGVLTITTPFFRTDLNEAEDIIEEIARLYGFDKLPQQLPVRTISPPEANKKVQLRQEIRKALVAAGANELLTYSFVDLKLLNQSGQDSALCYSLSNALSPELQYYRNLLLPSLLKKVHPNHKSGFGNFTIFEMGKTHQKNMIDEQVLPLEVERLALVISATPKMVKANFDGPGYYQARAYLDYMLLSQGLDPEKAEFKSLEEASSSDLWQPLSKIFLPDRSAVVTYNEQVLGLIGEFKQTLATDLKLPEFCAGFELDLNVLMKMRPKNQVNYHPLSRFPKVFEDLTISAKADQTYQQLRNVLIARLSKLVTEDMDFIIKLIDIYQSADNQANKSWTFRISVNSYQRTLIEKEVSSIIDNVRKSLTN